MGAEKFCLKWNDFESNISSAFRDLRKERDFFDVTLACDDNAQIEAHKTILSACSPFFRNVLKRNPHQHPLLYLKGVKHKVNFRRLRTKCILKQLDSCVYFLVKFIFLPISFTGVVARSACKLEFCELHIFSV